MSKDDEVVVKGIVKEACRGGTFLCEIGEGELTRDIFAYPSGKMRKHSIRIVPGDVVDIAMSPYDLTKGRITFRDK